MYTNENNGYITVSNNGAFYGAFAVTYYINGKFTAIRSPRMAISTSYTIKIPENATGISFTSYCYMTLSSTRIIYTNYFISPPSLCFYLWGTIFYAGCKQTSCPPSTSLPPIQWNPYCNCCCKC